MKAVTLAFFFAVVLGALCDSNFPFNNSVPSTDPPQDVQTPTPKPDDGDNLENKKLEELIEKILKSIQKQIRQAIKDLIKQITGRALPKFQNKLRSDIADLHARVQDIKGGIVGKLDSGASTVECIAAHSYEIDAVLNSTLAKTLNCADGRVNEIRRLISELNGLAQDVYNAATDALYRAQRCAQNGGGILITGACMRGVVLQTERSAIAYLTQTGVLLARANLSVATLPAALEVCSGTFLVEAGLATAGIAADIGRCSVSTTVSLLFDNHRDW